MRRFNSRFQLTSFEAYSILFSCKQSRMAARRGVALVTSLLFLAGAMAATPAPTATQPNVRGEMLVA